MKGHVFMKCQNTLLSANHNRNTGTEAVNNCRPFGMTVQIHYDCNETMKRQ